VNDTVTKIHDTHYQLNCALTVRVVTADAEHAQQPDSFTTKKMIQMKLFSAHTVDQLGLTRHYGPWSFFYVNWVESGQGRRAHINT